MLKLFSRSESHLKPRETNLKSHIAGLTHLQLAIIEFIQVDASVFEDNKVIFAGFPKNPLERENSWDLISSFPKHKLALFASEDIVDSLLSCEKGKDLRFTHSLLECKFTYYFRDFDLCCQPPSLLVHARRKDVIAS